MYYYIYFFHTLLLTTDERVNLYTFNVKQKPTAMRNLSFVFNRQYGKMQDISLVLVNDFTALNSSPWEPKLIYKILSADIICLKFLIIPFLLSSLEMGILMIAEGHRIA